MLERLGLAAAERTRRSLGARAGLALYDQLARNTADAEALGAALLGVIGCGLELGDAQAISRGVAAWGKVDGGAFAPQIVETAAALADAMRRDEALALARAEARMRPDARLLYLVARLEETASAFAAAEERADREGLARLAAVCRARRARLLVRAGLVEQGIELARGIDTERVSPEEVVGIARLVLKSGSRFVRAGAIGMLERAMASGDPACRRRAVAVALLHADELGDALTPLEADRVLALMKRAALPEAAIAQARGILTGVGASDHARAAIAPAPGGPALLRRVAAAREGGGKNMVCPDGGGAVRLAWLAIDACLAIRDGEAGPAALALMEIGRRLDPAVRTPRAVWTAVLFALGSGGPAASDAAVLADRLLGTEARAEAPPGGYARLAALLARAGHVGIAERALRRGAEIRQPEARHGLARHLVREAYRLARAGESAEALARLREGKRAS